MHRFSACVAVAAMLFALVSAPLFHIHDGDEHGHPGSLVHAHFPEPEHSGLAVETGHSHKHVRWLDDVFTTNVPVIGVFHAVVDVSERFVMPSPSVTRAVLSVLTLHAHSPPERFGLAPRSPPTI